MKAQRLKLYMWIKQNLREKWPCVSPWRIFLCACVHVCTHVPKWKPNEGELQHQGSGSPDSFVTISAVTSKSPLLAMNERPKMCLLKVFKPSLLCVCVCECAVCVSLHVHLRPLGLSWKNHARNSEGVHEVFDAAVAPQTSLLQHV